MHISIPPQPHWHSFWSSHTFIPALVPIPPPVHLLRRSLCWRDPPPSCCCGYHLTVLKISGKINPWHLCLPRNQTPCPCLMPRNRHRGDRYNNVSCFLNSVADLYSSCYSSYINYGLDNIFRTTISTAICAGTGSCHDLHGVIGSTGKLRNIIGLIGVGMI